MTSLDVRPLCTYLESSPTFSATFVKKAIISWLVTASISAIRFTSNLALALTFAETPLGTSPSSSIASSAANSTLSICCHSFSMDQSFPISSLVYLSIISYSFSWDSVPAVNVYQSHFACGSRSWDVFAWEALAPLKRRCFSKTPQEAPPLDPTKGHSPSGLPGALIFSFDFLF